MQASAEQQQRSMCGCMAQSRSQQQASWLVFVEAAGGGGGATNRQGCVGWVALDQPKGQHWQRQHHTKLSSHGCVILVQEPLVRTT